MINNNTFEETQKKMDKWNADLIAKEKAGFEPSIKIPEINLEAEMPKIEETKTEQKTNKPATKDDDTTIIDGDDCMFDSE